MAFRPGRVFTYNKKLPSTKSLLSRVLVSDFDISYTIYKFRTQTPKSSQTSCSFCFDVILRKMVYSNKIMRAGSFFWLCCEYIRHQNKKKSTKKSLDKMNDLLLGFLLLFWCDLKKNLQSILTIGVVPISDPPVDLCGATMEKKPKLA